MIKSVHDLYKVNSDRKHMSHQIYKTLYVDVMHKIKQKNDTYVYNLIYQPPTVVTGSVRYNRKTCIMYLMKKLVASGFIVFPYLDNRIYIDWSFTTNPEKKKNVTFKLCNTN